MDALDFCDDNGDGWIILTHFFRFCQGNSPEDLAALTLLKWLIQSSSDEIERYYFEERLRDAFLNPSPMMTEAASLLLDLSPAKDVDKIGTNQRYPPLQAYVLYGMWNGIIKLISMGADPHLQSLEVYHSPQKETPTSMAMNSSWAFWSFREVNISEIGYDVVEFVHRELARAGPLIDAGWRVETLRALFEFDFDPDLDLEMMDECPTCGRVTIFAAIQPYWQNTL